MIFDNLIFSLDDVSRVRKVSVNINDFDLYAQEVQRNYLQKILGDKLYTALVTDIDAGIPTDPRFTELVRGAIYSDGRDVIFRGVQLYCCYLWLHLYMADSAIAITPTGAKIFKDEQSEFNEGKQAYRNARDHYISAADGMEESILKYLRVNISDFPEFTESKQIEQAKADNFTFKPFGKTYRFPENNLY